MSLCTADASDSIVEVADRHRQLQNRAQAVDAIASVETWCEGRSGQADSPRFTTEVVLAAEFDAVPPTVLELLADLGLGLEPQPPHGEQTVVYVR